ncbi:MAG: MFS transporter [Phycisphaeraceae bacterium]
MSERSSDFSDPSPLPGSGADASREGDAQDPALIVEGHRERVSGRWSALLANLGRSEGIIGPIMLPVRGLRHAFSALRYPYYRIVWAGALVSNIGSWMQNIARDWLVNDLSGTTGKFWLGLNAFGEGIALILMLPLAGVLADRINRKHLLIITNAYQAVLAALLSLLAATGRLRPWHIVCFSAVNGLGDAVRIPAAQSMLPSLVGREDLSNAVALGSLQFNISRMLGPALGGVVLFYFGATWSFAINAVSFLAVIAALLCIPAIPMPIVQHRPMLQSFRQGLAFVRRRADLGVILLLIVTTGFLSAPITKLLAAVVSDLHGGDARSFAGTLVWFGGGAMLAAVLMAARSRHGPTPWRAMPIIILLGLVEMKIGQSDSLLLLYLLCAATGGLFIGIMVRLNTAVLYSSPDHVRGRMMSLQMLAFRGGMPLGAFAGGILGQFMGIRATLTLFGAGLVGAGLVFLLATRFVPWQRAESTTPAVETLH